MADLKKIDQAQLNSALTAQDESSQKSLSKEDSSTLLGLMDSLARRYPSQDQEGSIREYLKDYEKLALRFSLPKVAAALEELRIRPEQKFFPRPDEVADEIDNQRVEATRKYDESTIGWYGRKVAREIEEYNRPEEKAWRIAMGYESPVDGQPGESVEKQ